MKEIIIILACIPLFVVNSFCDKYASISSNTVTNLKYNVCKFSVGSLILLPIFFANGIQQIKIGTVICGALCGVFYTANKTITLKAYQKTSVSFITLCHASGLLLPYISGILFWKETVTLKSFIGILITVFSILLMKSTGNTKQKHSKKGYLLGLPVFLSSGGVMVLQKLMGLYFPKSNVAAYNFISFIVPAIFVFLGSKFVKNTENAITKLDKKVVLCSVGSAVSLCVISLVMTHLAGKVPSAVLFPLFNGTGIIAVCLGSIYVFKEKMNLKQIVGMFTAIGGMCLVSI